MNELRTKYLTEYITGQKGLSIEKRTLSNAFDYTFCGPLPAEGEPLHGDILYFAREQDIARLPSARGLKFVVLRRERRALPPSFLQEAQLIVCASGEKEFNALYERCRTAAAIDTQMGPAVMHLVAMAAQNCSLKELTKYMSDVYGSVVSIVDNAYTIMAYARWGDLPKEFEDDYTQGYLDSETVKGLNKINFLMPETATPQYRYYDFRKAMGATGGAIRGYSRNNYSVIFIDGLAVAAVSVFDDYDIDEYKLKYLEVISNVLSGYLQKLEFYSLNRGAYFSHLMSIIISESDFDPQISQRRLAVSGYRLNKYLYILAAGLEPFARSPGPADTLGMRLKNVLPNSIYVVMKDKLVFLMSPKEPLGQEDLARFDQFLRYVNVKAGVSDPFKTLGGAKVALAEALEALEIGEEMAPDQNIWLFGSCQFVSIVRKLLTCCGERNISMYLYPPLMELIEYDRQHKTAFAETLREYLRDSKNPRAVCERLFIHKNTLYYRLDKIRQIMAVDYTEQDVQLKITLTFAILDYAEHHKMDLGFGDFD